MLVLLRRCGSQGRSPEEQVDTRKQDSNLHKHVVRHLCCFHPLPIQSTPSGPLLYDCGAFHLDLPLALSPPPRPPTPHLPMRHSTHGCHCLARDGPQQRIHCARGREVPAPARPCVRRNRVIGEAAWLLMRPASHYWRTGRGAQAGSHARQPLTSSS